MRTGKVKKQRRKLKKEIEKVGDQRKKKEIKKMQRQKKKMRK